MSKEITIEIKSRWLGRILFAYSSVDNTLAKTVTEALKRGADLRGANLHGANLHGANLHGADLHDADLHDADLHGANLHDADLHGANLHDANLHGADLHDADLHGANLHDADLHDADLHGADLRGANLHGANLHGADLHGADLHDADLHGAKGGYMVCPSDGSFIGWKKAENLIVKLQIPEDARRSSAGTIKCRCNKALVLEIQNLNGTDSGKQVARSTHNPNFIYGVGATVEVPDFDANRWNECTSGIHFFIDRRAAVEY